MSYDYAIPIKHMDIALAAAWRGFENRTSIKFCMIENKRHYQAMVNVLDKLVDKISDREAHAMMGLLDIVSFFVHNYEKRDTEIPKPESHAVLRFFMEQHSLRQADLLDIFNSQSIVSDVLNGKREISALQARALAARFHVSAAVFI